MVDSVGEQCEKRATPADAGLQGAPTLRGHVGLHESRSYTLPPLLPACANPIAEPTHKLDPRDHNSRRLSFAVTSPPHGVRNELAVGRPGLSGSCVSAAVGHDVATLVAHVAQECAHELSACTLGRWDVQTCCRETSSPMPQEGRKGRRRSSKKHCVFERLQTETACNHLACHPTPTVLRQSAAVCAFA